MAIIEKLLLLVLISSNLCALSDAQIVSIVNKSSVLIPFWSSSIQNLYKASDEFLLILNRNQSFLNVFLNATYPNYSSAALLSINNINTSNLSSTYPQLLQAFLGLIIFLLCLIVVLIYFTVNGCCFGCYRKCGLCCGKTATKKKNAADKGCIVVLTIFLGIITAGIVVSTTYSFISASYLIEIFNTPESNSLNITYPVITPIILSVSNLFDFALGIPDEILGLLNSFNVGGKIDGLIASIKDLLARSFGVLCQYCGPTVNATADLINSLKSLTNQFQKLQDLKTNLTIEGNAFNANVTSIETTVTTLYNDTNCTKFCTKPVLFKFARNYSILLDQGPFLTSIKSLSNLNQYSVNGLSSIFNNVTDTINNTLAPLRNLSAYTGQINQLKITFASFKSMVFGFFSNANSNITIPLINIVITQDTLNKIFQGVEIAIKVIISLTALVLIPVIILNVIGLLSGPSCRKTKPKMCEKIFVYSTRYSFCCGNFIIGGSIVMFIIGSLLYTQVCYDVEKNEKSNLFQFGDKVINGFLLPVNSNINQSLQGIPILKNLPLDLDLSKLNIITEVIYTDCRLNLSLFTPILKQINETSILNYFSAVLAGYVEEASKSFNISNLPFPSEAQLNGVSNSLNQLTNSSSINISEISFLLALPLTILSIDNFAHQINTSKFSNPSLTKEFQAVLDNLTALNSSTTASQIIAYESEYLSTVATIFNFTTGTGPGSLSYKVNNLLTHFSNLTNEVTSTNVNVSLILKIEKDLTILLNLEIKKLLEEFFSNAASILHCKPVYDAVNSIFVVICSITNGLNSFWFILVIGVILLFPSHYSGLYLGGLYTRSYAPTEDTEKLIPSETNDNLNTLNLPENNQLPPNPLTIPITKPSNSSDNSNSQLINQPNIDDFYPQAAYNEPPVLKLPVIFRPPNELFKTFQTPLNAIKPVSENKFSLTPNFSSSLNQGTDSSSINVGEKDNDPLYLNVNNFNWTQLKKRYYTKFENQFYDGSGNGVYKRN